MARRLPSSEEIVTVLSEEETGCERAKHDARMAHAREARQSIIPPPAQSYQLLPQLFVSLDIQNVV